MKCIGTALLCFLRTGSLRRRKELCEEIAKCVDIPDTELVTADTSTVTLTGAGTAQAPLTAETKLSADSLNNLQMREDGLYVPPPPAAPDQPDPVDPLVFEDSRTVSWQGTGAADSPYKASTKISALNGNGITEKYDGIYMPDTGGPGSGVEFVQMLEFTESGFAPTTQVVGPVGARFQIKRHLNDPGNVETQDVSPVYSIPNTGVRACSFLLFNYGRFFIVHENTTVAAGAACAATIS